MQVTPARLRTVSDSVATCSLLLTLAVLIGVGVLSFRSTRRFLDNDQRVTHTYQVVDSLDSVLYDLQNCETGQRGYLLTGDAAYLQPYQTGMRAVPHDLRSLRFLTQNNPIQQTRLDTLQLLASAKLAELGDTISLRQQGNAAAALTIVRTGRGKDLMDQIRATVGQMQVEEHRLMAEHMAEAETAGIAARLWGGLGSLLAALLIATALGFVSRYLRQRKTVEAENLRLAETARDTALRQRLFLKDVLSSVTEGRLALCDAEEELPSELSDREEPIPLTRESGSRALRHAAVRAARLCGFSEERVQDLATSVSEAGMNAITHGGGGEGIVSTDGSDRVQIRIVDHGKGIALDALPQSTLERGYSSAGSLGHGFWLMLRMTDKVSLLTGSQGTTVVLEQAKDAVEAPWTKQETSQLPLAFKTINGGGGDAGPGIANRSFRTRTY